MQLLFEGSEESQGVEGLGVIPGQVTGFDATLGLPVPHMGWSGVSQKQPSAVLQHVKDGERVYFVHSYRVQEAEVNKVSSPFLAGRYIPVSWHPIGHTWSTFPFPFNLFVTREFPKRHVNRHPICNQRVINLFICFRPIIDTNPFMFDLNNDACTRTHGCVRSIVSPPGAHPFYPFDQATWCVTRVAAMINH
jgi:hypothetical protein